MINFFVLKAKYFSIMKEVFEISLIYETNVYMENWKKKKSYISTFVVMHLGSLGLDLESGGMRCGSG